MPKKVVSLAVPETPEKPVTENRSRMVFSIGAQRYAFDFHTTVTELKREPAEIIPLRRARKRKSTNRQA